MDAAIKGLKGVLDMLREQQQNENLIEKKINQPFDIVTSVPLETSQMIFKKLDFETLQTTRLVSKKWNDLGTVEMAKCCRIMILRIPEYNVVNKKLINSIVSSRGAQKHAEEHIKYHLGEKFPCTMQPLLQFTKTFGPEVQEIKMSECCNAWRENCSCGFRSVYSILTDFCPNLQHLNLQFLSIENLEKLDDISFPKSLALKSIILSFVLRHIAVKKVSKEISLFINKVLAASPDLEKLNMKGPCVPNLKSNTKLKKVTIWITREVQLNDCFRIISHLENSLEELSISSGSFKWDTFNQALNQSPEFLKLKTFKLENGDLTIDENAKFLSQFLLTKCPNVEILEIPLKVSTRKLAAPIVQKYFKSDQHLNISTLRLSNVTSKEILESLINFVPNLTHLEISSSVFTNLKCLHLCKNIESLQVLKIRNKLCYRMQDFVYTLTLAFIQMPYLSKLKLLGLDLDNADDDLTVFSIHDLEKAFLLTKGLKALELANFMVRPAYHRRLTNFVKHHQLPISFPTMKLSVDAGIESTIDNINIDSYSDDAWDDDDIYDPDQ